MCLKRSNPQRLAEYDLMGRLRELLDEEEYEHFVAAANRVKSGQFLIGNTVVIR